MGRISRLSFALFVALVPACAYEAPAPFVEAQELAGEVVDAEILNEGQQVYAFYCQACHGRDGDGRGPSSAGLLVPPRDFRIATFKFGGVVDGLPHDEDLARIVEGGLDGTAMLPWRLTDRELHVVLQYIKTFSPEGDGWRDSDETLGERIEVSGDPWEGKVAEAVERGKAFYHGVGTCYSCHPSFADKASIDRYRGAAKLPASGQLREKVWMSAPQVSASYSKPLPGDVVCTSNDDCGEGGTCCYGRCEALVRNMPPNFTLNAIRSGTDPASLFRVISAGIPGTAMPTWKGVVSDDDIWAVAHYVSWLSSLDTATGHKLRSDSKASHTK